MNDPKQRDAEATQGAILDAAQKVFVEKGFSKASVSEIAREAGVTKSLIHHHFGSKEGLWNQVKHHSFAEYAHAQQQILDEPSFDAELLRRSVEAYFRFLQRNPQFPRLVQWMHLEEAEAQGFEPAEDLTRMGVEKIRQAQEVGELRDDVDPFYILITFLGMALHWHQSKEHHCCRVENTDELLDDDAYLDAMMKIFFEGVLPR